MSPYGLKKLEVDFRGHSKSERRDGTGGIGFVGAVVIL